MRHNSIILVLARDLSAFARDRFQEFAIDRFVAEE